MHLKHLGNALDACAQTLGPWLQDAWAAWQGNVQDVFTQGAALHVDVLGAVKQHQVWNVCMCCKRGMSAMQYTRKCAAGIVTHYHVHRTPHTLVPHCPPWW